MNLNFELISKVEGHVLIILSLGLLGIRYFFHDYKNHKEKYNFLHIFLLMLFTIFALELLVVMIGFFLYYDIVDIELLSKKHLILYIYIPRLIFYSVLCYFLYWILKLFQKMNNSDDLDTL